MSELQRRRLLSGLGATGVACALATLVGCGSDSEEGGQQAPTPPQQDERSEQSAPAQREAGTELGPVSDVPVGGGKLYKQQGVFVTQPEEGDFRAFDAHCKHKGALVNKVDAGKIVCPWHQSTYDPETGAPVSGPGGSSADTITALDKLTVTVNDGTLVLG